MKFSEASSSKIEVLNEELGKVQENIALLQRYGVYNLTELVNKESNLKREIELLENERKNKSSQKDEFSDEILKDKNSPFYFRAESASITGDTVGDPLKDTSGPSLNILIKLSSILSVVFSPLFLKTSFLNKSTSS